jgi:O-antigen/teichoic acid export membrane protein
MSEERVSRNASFAFISQMIGALLTAALTIFLGRQLSPEQFGAFTFALSVIVIATLLVDLGMTSSTGRFMAERRGDPGAAVAVLRTAVRIKLLIGVPVTVLLLVLAGPICDAFDAGAATWPLRGCAIALLGQTMFRLFIGAFVALGTIRRNVLLTTIESVVETVASVVLVLLGAAATGAAFGRAIGYAVGLAAALVVAWRAIGALRSPDTAADRAIVSARRILVYAGPLLIVDAAFRLFASIDALLIAGLVGSGAPLAAFGLALRLVALFDYPAGAVAAAVAPRLARQEGRSGDVSLLRQSMRYLTIVQMLFTAPLLIWPEAIMALLFGDKYPEAPAVLRALVPFVFLSGIAQLTTLAVNYMGHARRRVPIAVAMLTVNVVVDIILLPRIGILGAAIGTSAAYAVWVPAHVWILRAEAGLRLRPLLITVARTCVAGAAMVGALALLGTGAVSFPVMVAGAVVGPAVYVAALLALRELTLEDVAVARGILARRVAR